MGTGASEEWERGVQGIQVPGQKIGGNGKESEARGVTSFVNSTKECALYSEKARRSH